MPITMRSFVHWSLVLATLVGIAAVLVVRSDYSPLSKHTYGPTSLPVGLEHAAQQYYKRGGHYVWGKNDCSMFLTDYLKAHDIQFSRRLTTKEFADPRLMRTLGLQPVKGKLKPGDVVVYRFRDGRSMGHCGIVFLKDGELEVVHNSGSMGGLAVSSFEAFAARAQEFGTRVDQILAYRPME